MDSCPVPDCKEPMPHEHRKYQYEMQTDTHWREVLPSEVELLNAQREAQGQPRLVFSPVRATPRSEEASA